MTARCSSAGIVSGLSGGLSAHCQNRSNASITGPPAAPEERVPHLSLGRLRAILDLGQKLGFIPDALVAHALGIGLDPSDEGSKPLLQVGGRDLVETVVDFAGVDQIVALAPADVEPVQLRPVECEAGNGQRLPLRAVVCASCLIGAAPDFRDDAFEAELAGVREQLAAVYLETFAELDVGAV
jgi:hypothetical protein